MVSAGMVEREREMKCMGDGRIAREWEYMRLKVGVGVK